MVSKIEINTAWCKGCGICAAFCPKKVLEVKNGKITVVNPEACIGCKLCEYRCPDFAIFVSKEGQE
ncbi:4Fe-4S binding protein [Tyzzerella sp. OttesenSCG-928-J15]|nr:4Fe-4S binding protein [Tyzzerella sp. OttesenSCG-928-J15]